LIIEHLVPATLPMSQIMEAAPALIGGGCPRRRARSGHLHCSLRRMLIGGGCPRRAR
jgi:hypothetical protein